MERHIQVRVRTAAIWIYWCHKAAFGVTSSEIYSSKEAYTRLLCVFNTPPELRVEIRETKGNGKLWTIDCPEQQKDVLYYSVVLSMYVRIRWKPKIQRVRHRLVGAVMLRKVLLVVYSWPASHTLRALNWKLQCRATKKHVCAGRKVESR